MAADPVRAVFARAATLLPARKAPVLQSAQPLPTRVLETRDAPAQRSLFSHTPAYSSTRPGALTRR